MILWKIQCFESASFFQCSLQLSVMRIFEMGRITLFEFPLCHIAYRDQGGVDFSTPHLAFLSQFQFSLEVWALQELCPRTIGLKSIKLQDLESAAWGCGVLKWAPLILRSTSLLVLTLARKASCDSNPNGDLGSLSDQLRKCLPNFYLHNNHWVFPKIISWALPAGILIQ